MRTIFESDARFYYAIGAFTIAVFALGLGVLAALRPGPIGTVELVGLVVGFLIYMLVYFVSLTVYRLADGDGT